MTDKEREGWSKRVAMIDRMIMTIEGSEATIEWLSCQQDIIIPTNSW